MRGMQEKPVCVTRVKPQEYYFKEGCFIAEFWNTLQDEAVSVARARVLSGKSTRLHRLHGIRERYIILEGEGFMEIDGQAPQKVVSGDVVYIPEAASQRITNTGVTDLVFLAVCTPRFSSRCYEDLEDSPLEAGQKSLDST